MLSETNASLGLAVRAWVIALAALLVAVSLFAYWRTIPVLASRMRTLLLALRIVALLTLAMLLMDPRSILTGQREEPARVVVMIDRSASMSLPAGGREAGETRFAAAARTAAELRRRLEARGARVDVVHYANHLETEAADTLRPDGQGSDLVGSLGELGTRYEGEHVNAVIAIGDGVETEPSLVRAPLPDLRVWTVGVGDTLAPDDVRIAGVAYSPVVRAPSRAIVTATVASTGSRAKRIHLRLAEGERTVFEADTSLAAGAVEAAMRIPVHIPAAGRREFVLTVSTNGTDAEPDNNRREVVIDAEKARAKILIVDLTPGWELAFLTALITRDPALEYEWFVTSRRPAAPIGRARRADQFVAALADADAVVLASVSEDFLSAPVTEAIRRFVSDRGGGLLVLPGPASLFETPAAWGRLAGVLPVAGSAPFSFTLQYTSVGPAARAAANPVTADLVPLLSQSEWQERAPLLGFYAGVTPTAAAEVLVGVRGRNVPALAYTTVGKGRVAAIAAGPLWRWKFVAESNGVYDELMSRLLDVLTRGEESGRFVLVAAKNVFDAGESPELYAEVFNEKLQPVTGAPVWVEVARVGANGAETPLDRTPMRRERPDDTRLSVTLDALPPGRYTVRGSAELPDRVIQSKALEIRVSETSVEFQRTQQDRSQLERVARRTGGAYLSVEQAPDVADRLDVSPRVVATTSETVLRSSGLLFVLVLALLSCEWLLRKRAGMI
jgi:hypothetical protein